MALLSWGTMAGLACGGNLFALNISLMDDLCIYIYIYIEREREYDEAPFKMLPCKTDLGPISRCSLYICIYIPISRLHIQTYIYIYPTAQEPCTEIINSAVADVADMAHVTDGNPNKRCPVLCGLARIPHGVSEASQKNRYLYNYF